MIKFHWNFCLVIGQQWHWNATPRSAVAKIGQLVKVTILFLKKNKKPTRNLDILTETTGECWDPPWWITNEIRCRRSSSIGRWSHSDDLAGAVSSSEYVDRSDVPPVSSSTWIAALLKFSDLNSFECVTKWRPIDGVVVARNVISNWNNG